MVVVLAADGQRHFDEEWMLRLFVLKLVLLVEEDASDKYFNRLDYFASVKQQLPLQRFHYSS